MNVLLQPDPRDPQQQFYDHPVDAGHASERLAELARLGWRPLGRPRPVLVDGQRHSRYVLAQEPAAGHAAGAAHGGDPACAGSDPHADQDSVGGRRWPRRGPTRRR
jgi:hypothetical protein